MIAPAQTNGGTLDSAHKEFANGYVFAVYNSGDYIPVTFDVEDTFGEVSRTVIASGDLHHSVLMREDGGWRVLRDDSVVPTFDFRELQKVPYGVTTQGPDGEIYESYGYGLYEGEDMALCGFKINRVTAQRADRYFWNPGKVVQNEFGQAELFGFKQTDPRSCVADVGGVCDEDDFQVRLGRHKSNTEEK